MSSFFQSTSFFLSIHFFFILWAVSFHPRLGCTRSRGIDWEVICLSRQPIHSNDEVDGMDIGWQHDQRFVLLRHTHRPQKGPRPICTSRSGNVRRWFGGGAGPMLSLLGPFRESGCRCRVWKYGVSQSRRIKFKYKAKLCRACNFQLQKCIKYST